MIKHAGAYLAKFMPTSQYLISNKYNKIISKTEGYNFFNNLPLPLMRQTSAKCNRSTCGNSAMVR
jgi:hypothetical protein